MSRLLNAQPKDGQDAKPTTAMEFLEKHKMAFAYALPRHITVERMMRLVASSIRENDRLMAADQKSFIGAVLQCCFLGLEPGSAYQHIVLIPYWDEKKKKDVVKPILQYQGMVELMDRAGLQAFADVVYKHDFFTYEMSFMGNGHPQKPVHRPDLDAKRSRNPADIRLAYAVTISEGNRLKFDYLSTLEIQSAHQKKTDPWQYHWSEMAKKTALRRIYKTSPKTAELTEALKREEDDNYDYSDLVDELVPEIEAKPARPEAGSLKADLDNKEILV